MLNRAYFLGVSNLARSVCTWRERRRKLIPYPTSTAAINPYANTKYSIHHSVACFNELTRSRACSKRTR
jgi:hypothetical protein